MKFQLLNGVMYCARAGQAQVKTIAASAADFKRMKILSRDEASAATPAWHCDAFAPRAQARWNFRLNKPDRHI